MLRQRFDFVFHVQVRNPDWKAVVSDILAACFRRRLAGTGIYFQMTGNQIIAGAQHSGVLDALVLDWSPFETSTWAQVFRTFGITHLDSFAKGARPKDVIFDLTVIS